MSSLLNKAVGGIGCALLALPLMAALIVGALISGLLSASSVSAAPSKHALADIPTAMLTLYQRAAADCRGLSWAVLAAIGKVETDHGRHPTMISSAGAVGPMQFLPSTFAAYAHPVPPGGKNPPTPWDPVDAVYAAARLLCVNGARDGKNVPGAIYQYNHSRAYVRQVLAVADRYQAQATRPTARAASAVAFARRQLGTPYRWGGDGPAEGGFDCSGLTKAAYLATGITLPRTAEAQYHATAKVPRGLPLLPGDLVFYGRPGNLHHVGIYIGHNQMINAPHPGARVRIEDYRWKDYWGATRPAARGGTR
ncbi:bifunctional lytic transglycosylase/C40 family peptidase [Streptomyces sp. NPDC042319]|uniref:C40 family peptidase n=1 Tax=Streptomyces sp. NPDC042319 TaxID=3154332 RepID=UPI00340DC26D